MRAEESYSLPLGSSTRRSSLSCEETALDKRILSLYEASVELAEVGISTVMVPNIANRFSEAIDSINKAETDEDDDPAHAQLFTEALQAYMIYGKMECIVCEMECLVHEVVKVLDQDSNSHGLDLLTGRAIGTELTSDADDTKTNMIMERVFKLLAALSEEAKSFNYTAWLHAMRDDDDAVTEIVDEFNQHKQEIRKILMICYVEAGEFLNSRLLVAAVTFSKWFEKMRKAAEQFEEFVLKQCAEEGFASAADMRKMMQKNAEERKKLTARLAEVRDGCKRQALDSHGKRFDAQAALRKEREEEKESEGKDGVIQNRKRLREASTMPLSGAATTPSPGRRASLSSKRSSHMEEQISNFMRSARGHLDQLQALDHEHREKEQKASETC
ncbi:unnamed protein product [Effrenium voratum]|nr:unnamed protein product [Effrenium voratum]